MRTKESNCLNKKRAATENFEMGSVSNEEMFKENETAKDCQLFNSALALATYSQTDKHVEQLFVEHISKHHIAMKCVTCGNYIQACTSKGNRK